MMRLSEAIRLGAMVRPQERYTSLGKIGTCALGAALEAIGQATPNYTRVLEFFPITHLYVAQPVSGQMMYLFSAVRELNDEHLWTREQIADWVETIEPVENPSADPRETTEAPDEPRDDERGTEAVMHPSIRLRV